MPLLLELLRGRGVDLVHDPGYDPSHWDQALALAEEEHILPWVAHLCARRPSTPPNLNDRLKAIERNAAITAFYWISELKGILHAFDQQDIVVVPLKGPFLAERLFGDAALRVSYDLDLLVSQNDLARAEAALSALGFTPATPDDYHRQWYRSRTTVELHHDVENPLAFNFHIASVLGRVQPASFQGQRCWKLAPGDELLFLCLHGVRHRFERLSLILDLCFAFEKLTLLDVHATSDPQPNPQIAERSSLLTLGLAMARRLQPTTMTNANPNEIENEHSNSKAGAAALSTSSPALCTAHRNHLEALADRLWHSLLTQPSQPLDWRAQHAFYLEIDPPGPRLRRRLRHLQILLGRVIQPDYDFAARLGCHRVWQVRLLRPLRLLRDALANSDSSGEGSLRR